MNPSLLSCPLALSLSLLSLANYLPGSLRESKQGTDGTCKRAQTTTHTRTTAREEEIDEQNGNKPKIPRTANDCSWRGLRGKTATVEFNLGGRGEGD